MAGSSSEQSVDLHVEVCKIGVVVGFSSTCRGAVRYDETVVPLEDATGKSGEEIAQHAWSSAPEMEAKVVLWRDGVLARDDGATAGAIVELETDEAPLDVPLADIFRRLESWHVNKGTNKGCYHSYTATYERLFGGVRESVRRVMEIGVNSGASLAAWAAYFPQAHVTGLDISLQNQQFAKAHPRVSAHIANATSPAACLEFLGGDAYDVVIDDGSHAPDDQLAALALWAPRAKIMVIEDVNLTKHPELDVTLARAAHHLGLEYELVDLRQGRLDAPPDDVLAIFTRRSPAA